MKSKDTPRAFPPELVEALHGRFIVFDGPDGSGKSSQLERTVEALAAAGTEAVVVREPGGTPVGEQIRQVILAKHDEPATPICETLLFMASRAQLIERRIRPALEAGRVVLTDRFTSSTLAYQGSAGGVPAQAIRDLAAVACGDIAPDLTVIFDLPTDVASRRLHGTKKAIDEPKLFEDGMESRGRAFFERVRAGYLEQIAHDKKSGANRYALVDASPTEEQVFAHVVRTLTDFFVSENAS